MIEERLEKLHVDEIRINNGRYTVIGYRYNTGISGVSISDALDNLEKELAIGKSNNVINPTS